MAIFDFLNSQQTGTLNTTTSIDPQIKQAYLSNLNFADTVASRPFQQYGGPRIAGFTPDQQASFGQIRGMQGQFQPMINQAQQGIQSVLNMQPGQIQYNGPQAQGFGIERAGLAPMGATALTTGQGYNPATMQGVSAGPSALARGQGYNAVNANAVNAGRGALTQGQGYNAATAQAANAGQSALSQAAAINRGGIRNLTPGSFLSGNIAAYQNPYTDQVVNQTMRDIERQRTMADQGVRANAVRSGAFGGTREAIAREENNRNFLDTSARTLAQLRNQGFDTAANLMQSDIGRDLQAQQANQGVDLNVLGQNAGFLQQSGLANQAAQNQMSQFNAANQQTSNLANQAAQNQAGAFGASATNAANMANQASQNQFAQLNAANQQAANFANQAAQNQAGQFGASASNTANLANQAAQNQMAQFNAANQQAANTNNMGALNQAGAFGASAANTANLANQGARNQAIQALFGAGNQMNQFNAANQNEANQFLAGARNQFGLTNAAQNLQAQLANQANQLAFGSQRLGAAGQLGGLANLQQQLGLTGSNALNQIGQQQQAQTQRNYDLANQDFQNQFNYPLQQLAIRQSALGANIPNTGQTQSQPLFENRLGQLLGLGQGINGLFGGGQSNGQSPVGSFLGGIGSSLGGLLDFDNSGGFNFGDIGAGFSQGADFLSGLFQ